MPKLSPTSYPKLRRHRPSGLGVVTLSGKDHYCGRWPAEGDNPPAEVEQRYREVVGRWIAHGRRPLPPEGAAPPAALVGTPAVSPPVTAAVGTPEGITVGHLIVAFWEHAVVYYRRPDGRPSRELEDFLRSLRPLRELYQDLPVAEFGGKALQAVRGRMVEAGWSRGVVNQRVGRVRRVFRWGVGDDLVPPDVVTKLENVKDLPKNRSTARETEKVLPVPDEHVEAVLPFLLPPVRAMVELQRLTGMRPGEVVIMRAIDIDTSNPAVWRYRPSWHKMAWKDQDRVVFLGPAAQAVVRPFLVSDTTAYLFSPARAMAELRARQRAARTTPVQPSQANRAKAAPRKRPGERYTARSYTQAVATACKKAGVPRWGVNRLRHSFGTEVRAQYGLEASQVLLGHKHAKTSEIYAERDLALGERIAAQAG
jgi:integrase